MTATDVVLISTECAACGLPSKDSTDARTGLDQACRAQYEYKKISALPDTVRAAVNKHIHDVANNTLRGEPLRAAITAIYEAGFIDLAQRIERRVGGRVVAMPPPPPPPVITEADIPVAPSEAIRPPPFEPTADQRRALDVIRAMCRRPGFGVAVIVGFAGVGKSASILFIAHEHGHPIVITPTGRAAVRVKELTGIDAMTIHRWIYKAVEDPHTGLVDYMRRSPEEIEEKIPPSRIVVLDEASMVGPDVWEDIYSICRDHELKLICVGDGFQLPPVQSPNAPPFSILTPEFAARMGAQRIELTQVLRQAQDSPIIRVSMAIRNGGGMPALRELPQISTAQLAQVCVATFQQDGIIICHRNATRFRVNAGMRQALGIYDEMPQVGEPMLCRKNAYSAGIMNGESFKFEGWGVEPLQLEQVVDRYKGTKETARFGATRIGKAPVSLAVEELHGRLEAGPKAIEIAANQWAKIESLYAGSHPIPHVHAQWGYCYTAHAAQGGQWPFVLVILEPSIRLNEEEGRRWVYTAATRSTQMTAFHYGSV